MSRLLSSFFFQAEDGIRYKLVTGVQTCALPILVARRLGLLRASAPRRVAFTAHVAHVAGVDGVGELHVGDTGYVGLGPVGEGVTTVALVVPLRLVRAGATDYRAGLFAQLERFPGLAGRFDPRQLRSEERRVGKEGRSRW